MDSGAISKLASLCAYMGLILGFFIMARSRRNREGQLQSGVDGPTQRRRQLFSSVSFDRRSTPNSRFLVVVSFLALGLPLGEVVAQDTTAPMVSGVSFSSVPQTDDTYVRGNRIEVTVQFSEEVTVNGVLQLLLTVGAERRSIVYQGSGGQWLRFAYEVRATDLDTDGISVEVDALNLISGSIHDRHGNDAELGLGSHAIADDSAHKVDGSLDPAPTVKTVWIVSAGSFSPQAEDTFTLGDLIEVEIEFDENVSATGQPRLVITIGLEEREAIWTGYGPTRLVFTYEVQATDLDADGISIEMDALNLNGGSIQDESGNPANLSLGDLAIANAPDYKVDGSLDPAPTVRGVSIVSNPQSGDTFVLGNTIDLVIHFDEPVIVEGSPQLGLTIGTEIRNADLDWVGEGGWGLVFTYVVEANDLDEDGISVEVDALRLNGGSIRDRTGNDADLRLGEHEILNSSHHKVEGGQDPTPRITEVFILTTPQGDDTYVLGNFIEVTVRFSEEVIVSGDVQLALTIGSERRQAYFNGSSGSDLRFRYEVQATDLDEDGISIEVDALSLNDGSIRDGTGSDADLSLGDHVNFFILGHRVDGGQDLAPAVTDVLFSSDPKSGDTYVLGEMIELAIWFNEPVAVEGSPQLALKIGSETRIAVFTGSIRGSRISILDFAYTIQQEDLDADGISIAVDALTLNGGSIRDRTGNEAELEMGLGVNVVANDPRHKVKIDGSHVAVPKGAWTPDRQSRATFAYSEGNATITIQHGGRMEDEGVTYTCLSSEECRVEATRITTGTLRASETVGVSELMIAGVAELVDDQTEFQGKTYNGYELEESTVTFRSVAGETTRVSFLDLDGDLVFVDFSSDDPATEMVITLEEFSGTLEESPYDQPDMRYARGLATVTMINPTELTWLRVVSLGNHIDRVDLALIEDDTFAGDVDGIADIKAVVIEGAGRIGAIDAANANFVGSSGENGIDAAGTIVKRVLSIGDITPSEGTTPVLRVSAESLDPANAAEGETVIAEIQIAGGDLREAVGALQIDTGGIVYDFPIVAVDGERSIRNSELRPDLGDGILEAVTDTFVANPDDYFVTDGQKTGVADSTE